MTISGTTVIRRPNPASHFVPPPPSPNDFAELDILATVGSFTPWKLTEYQAIAAYLRHTGGPRIAFWPLNRFADHHSAVENGTTGEANAIIKLNDTWRDFNSLAPGQKRHRSFRERLEREGVTFRGGKSFVPERVVGMVDDSTIAIPADVFRYMLPRLRENVIAGSLKATPLKDNPDMVSVTDIGLMSGAMGISRFWDLTRRAALRAGYKDKPIPVISEIRAAYSTMSSTGGAQRHEIRHDSHIQLFVPEGLTAPVRIPCDVIPTSEHFFALPEDTTRAIAHDDASYGSYLLHRGPRQGIVRKLLADFGHDTTLFRTQSSTSKIIHLFSATTKKPKPRAAKRNLNKNRIIQPSLGGDDANNRTDINYRLSIRHALNNGKLDEPAFFNAMSMEFVSRKGHVKHADAVLLRPFDVNDRGQRVHNAAMFNAAAVAKMLDARYQDVPLIILNLRGCYDTLIKSHLAYAQGGYSKEFRRPPVHGGHNPAAPVVTQPGVTHHSLHYLSVLSGDDEAKLMIAAQQLLDAHFSTYHRAEAAPQPLQSAGIAKPNGLHAFTFYGSASSSNLPLTKDALAGARLAAELGSGLVTGAGDLYVMGAFNEGYASFNDGYVSPQKGPWLAGISTHGIVKVENATGHIPQACDYWVLVNGIGQRLSILIDLGDTHVSFGGGNGTGQEGNVFAALKHFMPEKMGAKNLVFVGNSRAKQLEIESIVGAADFKKMKKDGDALADQGMFWRPHLACAAPVLRRMASDFNRRIAANPNCLKVA